MKKFITVGIFAVFTFIMTACGTDNSQQKETVNTLSVQKNGSVENLIVEDFGEEYYNVDSLTSMIQDTITEYQKKNPSAEITLKSCELEGDQIKVLMQYDSSDTYTGYNSETLFTGTVQEAYAAGYDLNMTLHDVKDDTKSIGKQELLGMGEKHIMIMELSGTQEQEVNTMRLKCFGDILYIGDGISLVSRKIADIEQAQGLSVVVFK